MKPTVEDSSAYRHFSDVLSFAIGRRRRAALEMGARAVIMRTATGQTAALLDLCDLSNGLSLDGVAIIGELDKGRRRGHSYHWRNSGGQNLQ